MSSQTARAPSIAPYTATSRSACRSPKSAIEFPRYNLLDKALGLNVYGLLGSKGVDTIQLGWTASTEVPVGVEASIAERRDRAYRGYRAFKVKIGLHDERRNTHHRPRTRRRRRCVPKGRCQTSIHDRHGPAGRTRTRPPQRRRLRTAVTR
jgi:L-alanine-DL-glutamate epimerase-like enolase superfamily enzyme